MINSPLQTFTGRWRPVYKFTVLQYRLNLIYSNTILLPPTVLCESSFLQEEQPDWTSFILFQRVSVPEGADFGSRRRLGRISEWQINCAQHKTCKHLCINSEEHQFTCDVCKKCCKWPSSSKVHMCIHTREKLFTCDVCKKTFSQSGALKSHQNTHSGNGLCTCDVYKKSCIYSSYLKMHLRIHTGEKPFTCGVCKKSFSQSSSLRYIYSHILVSINLPVIYVRKHSLILVTCRSIYAFIEGSGHLRVTFVRNISNGQVLWRGT